MVILSSKELYAATKKSSDITTPVAMFCIKSEVFSNTEASTLLSVYTTKKFNLASTVLLQMLTIYKYVQVYTYLTHKESDTGTICSPWGFAFSYTLED